MDPRAAFAELEKRVAQDVVGQGALVRQVLIGLLANGHLRATPESKAREMRPTGCAVRCPARGGSCSMSRARPGAASSAP